MGAILGNFYGLYGSPSLRNVTPLLSVTYGPFYITKVNRLKE